MSIAITAVACTDDVVTLTVASVTGLVVGETVHVYNTGFNKLDGHHQLTFVATGTVKYNVNNQDDIPTTSVTGVLVEEPTWIDSDDVELFLGIDTPNANDTAFIAECVLAANIFAFRRRRAAGYNDSPVVAPNGAVKMGTVLYGAALYRERGSIDSFSSFGDQVIPGNVGTMGQIMRLLGINRPAVA